MSDFYSEKRVKAAKDHQCYWCKETIHKGESYVRVAGVNYGYFNSRKECVDCNYLVIEYCNQHNDDARDYGIEYKDLIEFKKKMEGLTC